MVLYYRSQTAVIRANLPKLDLSSGQKYADLVANWRLGGGPLHRHLADWLRETIERGDLVAGAQLPPERTLAGQFGLSRTTVIGAYDLLRAEGWLQSRRGSGTFVAEPKAVEGHRDQLMAQLARNPIFSGLIDSPAATIDFAAASPRATTKLAAAARLALDDLEPHLRGHGYFTSGLPALRKPVAAYLANTALPTTEDELLVTTGSQQALSLLATLYVSPGDAVVVETPTYPGALDALRSAGARLFTIPVGKNGVQPDDLRRVLSRTRSRLAYITPSFNNPTGSVVPLAARRELAQAAADFQTVLVEDHVLADIAFDGTKPPPPISAFPNEGNVIMVGSLSKLFWGGLRVGWVRAPRPVIKRLARIKALADLASSVIPQLIAARLLPLIDEVKAERRSELESQRDQATSLLQELLPSWSWERPLGGISLWVRLPQGNASDFAEVALRHGVAIVPGPTFCPDEDGQDYLRLPFCLDANRLESGIRRLTRAWAAYAPISAEARSPLHRAIV